MKSVPLLLAVGLSGLTVQVSHGQLSNVTRRTLQGGAPFVFVTGANTIPSGAGQPAFLPQLQPAPVLPAARTEPRPGADTPDHLTRLVAFQKQCAEKGLPTFQYELGLRYLSGDGVENDVANARKWLSLSAKQGNKDAIKKLEGLEQTAKKQPATQ